MALKIGRIAGLALVVTIAVVLMAWLIGLSGLSVSVAPLFSVQDTISGYLGALPQPVSPFTSSVSAKVFGFLSGYIPGGQSLFDVSSWAIIYFASFFILLVGAFVVGFYRPKVFSKGLLAKGESVFWALMFGTVAFWLLIVGMNLAPTAVIGGLILYLIPVSLVSAWIAGKFGMSVD